VSVREDQSYPKSMMYLPDYLTGRLVQLAGHPIHLHVYVNLTTHSLLLLYTSRSYDSGILDRWIYLDSEVSLYHPRQNRSRQDGGRISTHGREGPLWRNGGSRTIYFAAVHSYVLSAYSGDKNRPF